MLRPERNQRAHLSSVLSRNEVARDYAYNRGLFLRVQQASTSSIPGLAVRRKTHGEERWVPVFEALNLPWVGEFTLNFVWPRVETRGD